MKKLLCLALALSLLLPVMALAAAIDYTALTDEELSKMAADIAAEQLARAKSRGGYLFSGTYDDATIELKDYQVQADGDNKTLVLVFDYSTVKDEANMFPFVVSVKVIQDGVELESNYFFNHPSNENYLKRIKKGEVLEVAMGYKLISSSPVVVEMNSLYGDLFGQKPDSITLDLP